MTVTALRKSVLKELRLALRAGAAQPDVADTVGAVLDDEASPEDRRLLEPLMPRADEILVELRTKARFKRLRRALRELVAAEEEVDDDDDGAVPDTDVPPDWPFWSATVGKRAAIIGGDLREDARVRLERLFRFTSLRWVTSDHLRGAQQLAQSIRSGGVDLVHFAFCYAAS